MDTRKITAIVVLSLSFIALPNCALAKYSGGSGTSGDPYLISNGADIIALGATTSDYSAYFILTKDIDMGGSSSTTAVIAPDTNSSNSGFDGTEFTGTFDGKYHKIYNLAIYGEGSYYVGLFGEIAYPAYVKNLRLENVDVRGFKRVGGLVGENRTGHVLNCSVAGSIVGDYQADSVGGLVGFNAQSVSQCFSTASVTVGDESTEIGGLIGENYSPAVLTNCYSTGVVTGGKKCALLGGLVGYDYYSAAFSCCYAAGSVTADSCSQELGGLVGYRNNSPDQNSLDSSHDYFLETTGPDNGIGTPLMISQMTKKNNFVNWHDYTWRFLSSAYPTLQWQWQYVPTINVTKCTVATGSKGDSISFSGITNAEADDFNDANNSSDANVIVAISPEDTNYSRLVTFPVNGQTWKKGKYSYSGTDANGVKKSFSYDPKSGKFSCAASGIDLSGLSCPITVEIDINDFSTLIELDEMIVNGTKKPMPIALMMDCNNVLRVDKCTVKKNKNINKDQLTASGGFAVANTDPRIAHWITDGLVVTLGSQQFAVPKNSLKPGKGQFSCSKADANEGGGTVAGTFNFNLCSFTLTIKDANMSTLSNPADFGIAFGDFNEVQPVSW